MPTTLTTQTALQWLKTGQAPQQRLTEVVRALALLSGEVAITADRLKQLGPDVEMALLVEAEARGRLDLVQHLSNEAASKTCAKHAKKLLFRAKQRGVVVPEHKVPVRAPVNLATQPEPLPSYASSFDGTGGQLLLLGGWAQTEGPYCLMAMVSDTEGLISAWYLADTSRTQQREMLDRLKNQFPGFAVQVPEGFAAGRIRWGLERRDALKQTFEGDQAEVRRVLADVEAVPAVDVELDPEDEARIDERIEAAASLVVDPSFATWLSLPRAVLQDLQNKALQDKDKTLESEVARQKAQVLRDAAVDAWLDTSTRERLADRLEMTSWLLVMDGRREHALLAVSTARGLRDAKRPAYSLGFVRAAVERTAPIASLADLVGGELSALAALQPR
jgi:hypothetical protein